jgi:hypothetical protein
VPPPAPRASLVPRLPCGLAVAPIRVLYGALSNVEDTLTVTDSETGTVRTYTNPRGRFASAADSGAF